MNKRLILLYVALFLSPGAQALEKNNVTIQPDFPLNVRYLCDGGRLVVVEYPDPDDASHPPIDLLWRGHHYQLQPDMSASGARYTNSAFVWWNKGQGGFLTTRGGRMLANHCKERPPLRCS